ncbi:MAG: PilZ domain-containing protein [Acidobacteriia bacterium]|nr:PilZ domain-containing protein [Terriglobia bacterium]
MKTKSPMTLSWQDTAGNRCCIDVQAVDMSSQGARVESPEPMAPGAYVLLEAPKLKLMGSAIVRHCGLRGKKYQIGLDFRNSLSKSY